MYEIKFLIDPIGKKIWGRQIKATLIDSGGDECFSGSGETLEAALDNALQARAEAYGSSD